MLLTMVSRPSPSSAFSIGSVSSRNSSSRRRNEDTVSSMRPRPSCSLLQSSRMMGGRWAYYLIRRKTTNENQSHKHTTTTHTNLLLEVADLLQIPGHAVDEDAAPVGQLQQLRLNQPIDRPLGDHFARTDCLFDGVLLGVGLRIRFGHRAQQTADAAIGNEINNTLRDNNVTHLKCPQPGS